MFRTSVEVKLKTDLEQTKRDLERSESAKRSLDLLVSEKVWLIKELEWKLKNVEKEAEIKQGEAILAFKKESLQKLSESDIKREVAQAKLEVYEKFDAKDDHNQIKTMLTEAIKGLSQQSKVIVTAGK